MTKEEEIRKIKEEIEQLEYEIETAKSDIARLQEELEDKEGRTMKKLLKIRLAKFEKGLVMQVLEQVGEFSSSKHVKSVIAPELYSESIHLRGRFHTNDEIIANSTFKSNAERDEYLENVINWITNEQFSRNKKLEIGEKCEASDDGEEWYTSIFAGKLAKQLGEPRYLVAYDGILEDFKRYKYVRPIKTLQPKIDGDVYTWKMEVAE